ncbi:MAG: UDP-N-acetylenolpyruvoylglucosamine reductase, partial [Candidatus Sumerlaeota bacterium]|nr:UDP-N-acetylenolpyruvoylglucosamine reductase [Candidatus Sumerlaeota bacterium]
GGASVSTRHANWIINNGNASASDVISLITEMRDKVHKKFRVLLEPEVKIIGEGF